LAPTPKRQKLVDEFQSPQANKPRGRGYRGRKPAQQNEGSSLIPDISINDSSSLPNASIKKPAAIRTPRGKKGGANTASPAKRTFKKYEDQSDIDSQTD
jgi:hypothetical protein